MSYYVHVTRYALELYRKACGTPLINLADR